MPAADGDEAGYSFWQAVRGLKGKDYKAGGEKLEAGRKAQVNGRLIRIGRQQNPESDPTEAIFLKCADELRIYWALKEKYDAPGSDLEKKILASAGGGDKALAEKLITAKLIADPKEVATGVDNLLKVRAELAKKLDAKDADKFDAAIAAFLKDKGGLDQLQDERQVLAAVAKTVGAQKADDVKTRATELVGDGDLLKKLGDKLTEEKVVAKIERREDIGAAVGKLVADWKEIPGLKTNLDKAKTQLATALTFGDDLYKTRIHGEY